MWLTHILKSVILAVETETKLKQNDSFTHSMGSLGLAECPLERFDVMVSDRGTEENCFLGWKFKCFYTVSIQCCITNLPTPLPQTTPFMQHCQYICAVLIPLRPDFFIFLPNNNFKSNNRRISLLQPTKQTWYHREYVLSREFCFCGLQEETFI